MLAWLATMPVQAAPLRVDHVNGYTLDGAGKLRRFQALLVDDGKVVATGSHDELMARAHGATIVDGRGRTMLPGLIDAHGHVMELGQMRVQVDLTTSKSLAEALAGVTAFAAAHPESAWIRGRGWNQVVWKLGRFPTAVELDAVLPDRPAWLERAEQGVIQSRCAPSPFCSIRTGE